MVFFGKGRPMHFLSDYDAVLIQLILRCKHLHFTPRREQHSKTKIIGASM